MVSHFAVPGFTLLQLNHEFTFCLVFIVMMNYVMWLPSWCLAGITLEQVVAVLHPHKIQIWVTKTKVGIYLGLTTLLVLPNVYYAFVAEYIPPIGGFCLSIVPHHTYILTLCDLILGSIVPFIVILTGNIIIIMTVVKQRGRMSGSCHQGSNPQTFQLTITLIAVSVAYIVLTLPAKLSAHLMNASISINDSWDYLLVKVVQSSLEWLSYVNSGINFWLYCMTGTQFREKFVKLLRQSVRCCRDNTGN